jgi:hypothetical protein
MAFRLDVSIASLPAISNAGPPTDAISAGAARLFRICEYRIPC